MIARAAAGECDVIVKGTVGGQQRGWHAAAAGNFQSDRASEPLITDAVLRLARQRRRPGADLHRRAARQRHRASASTATRTATSIATSSTPAPIRPTRTARRPT